MRRDITPSNKHVYVAYESINDIIKHYGEIGIGILPNDFSKLTSLLQNCDGVILQGGDDFTNLDLDIISYLYEKNIPTLGICLGMQSMAYLFGGTIKRLIDDSHMNRTHKVFTSNSKIYGSKTITVNSRHHDYIINTSLEVTGVSEDEVIEMIEDKTKHFFVGVEWHPEDMYEENNDAKMLFEQFFEVIKSSKKH